MGIYATSYITKGVSAEDVAEVLVSSFAGQLKNWLWKIFLLNKIE